MSAVNGMLYRIVPFLVWHGLRAATPPGVRVPKIGEIVGAARLRAQGRWHAAAVLAALGACAYPLLARCVGLLLAAASLRLGVDLVRPVWRHRRALRNQPRHQPS